MESNPFLEPFKKHEFVYAVMLCLISSIVITTTVVAFADVVKRDWIYAALASSIFALLLIWYATTRGDHENIKA